jgi:hypothetical protein
MAYRIKKPLEVRGLVPSAQLITNQIYLDFKKLYDLKPILEDAGLYPIITNNQVHTARF